MIYIRTQSMQVKVQSFKNDVVWERVNLKAWNEECSLYIRIPQKREKREGLMKSSLMQMKRSDTAKLCAVFNLDMEDPNVRLDDRAELVEYTRQTRAWYWRGVMYPSVMWPQEQLRISRDTKVANLYFLVFVPLTRRQSMTFGNQVIASHYKVAVDEPELRGGIRTRT